MFKIGIDKKQFLLYNTCNKKEKGEKYDIFKINSFGKNKKRRIKT